MNDGVNASTVLTDQGAWPSGRRGLVALAVLALALPVGPAWAQEATEGSEPTEKGTTEGSEPTEESAPARRGDAIEPAPKADDGADEERGGAGENAPAAPARPTEARAPLSSPPSDEVSSEAATEASSPSSSPSGEPRARAASVEAASDAASPSSSSSDEPRARAASAEAATETGAPDGDEDKSGVKKLSEDDDATAALGAASPVVASETGKPWQLMANAGASLGSSTFTRNQATQGGLSFALTGLYRLAPLWEGRLDGLVRIAGDGTVFGDGFNAAFGATSEREWFFRDVRIGLLGRGLYHFRSLGLTFGANTTIDLPTSYQAQFWGRIARWNVGVNMAEMLQKVGPGNLLFVLFGTFRKDIGEVNPSVDQFSDAGNRISICRGANQTDAQTCFTDLAPLNFAFIYGGSTRYFLGKWSMGLGVTFVSNFNHDLGDSELPPGTTEGGIPWTDVADNASPFANPDAPPHTLLMFTSVDLTYVVSRYLNLSASLSSFQSPIRFIGDNPRGLAVPFFDSSERNTTNVALNATIMY